MSELQLNPVEARVLAALAEKSVTTPQYYPMSVNAIMLAANQKTCRAPVTNLSEGEVGSALNHLEELSLVKRDDYSSRVTKWRHSFQHQLLLQPQTMAVLATLVLRGPQTVSELRANAVAMGGPADAAGMATALQDLADRAHPYVVLLPRASGQKEARYAHTLSGTPESGVTFDSVPLPEAGPRESELAALTERVRQLEARLGELESGLGMTRPPAA
ncbi:MAG TPA: DUF480 domain-containing protein [Solimonas sp.]|nr:DUF480 domain-containing protein [Solimonas sp.]